MEPLLPLPSRRDRSSTAGDLGIKYDSPNRTATQFSAIFNLVSTVVGGGVLSLPFAISSQGIFGGAISILLSALAAEFSIYILIASSRSRGARGYEDVAAAALGEPARMFILILLFSLTFLILIAYSILATDILGSIVDLATAHHVLPDVSRKYVVAAFIVCVSPLAFFRKMTALKMTSVLSVCSVTLLGLVTAYTLATRGILRPAIPANATTAPSPSLASLASLPSLTSSSIFRDMHMQGNTTTLPLGEILWWPLSIEEYIYALPISTVAFLCHFNVLPMQDELQKPTRANVLHVTRTTILISTLLYSFIGYLGYVRFTSSTCGDFLNNYPNDDPIALIGRSGLLMTLYCSFPMVILPCRSALSRLMDVCCGCSSRSVESEESTFGDAEENVGTAAGAGANRSDQVMLESLLSPMGSFIADSPMIAGDRVSRAHRGAAHVGYGTTSASIASSKSVDDIDHLHRTNGLVDQDHTTEVDQTIAGGQGRTSEKLNQIKSEITQARHCILTILLLVSTLLLAMQIESVVTVWSIAGSSVAMCISLTLPCLFYIRLRRGGLLIGPWNCRLVTAHILLFVSLILIGLCSWQAVNQLGRPNCPERNH